MNTSRFPAILLISVVAAASVARAARKDARSLRLTVGFAGEQHEFEFIVPKDAQ